MEDIPLSAQLAALIVLLAFSGFFSLAETAMMAANRYRLRAAAVQSGKRGAKLALELLAKTNKLLGVILLFNTLFNAASATLAGLITVRLFGEEKWALGVGTLVITFLILVFSEITPKVVAATYPDKLAIGVSYVLAPLLQLFNPVISMVNLLVTGVLKLLRLKTGTGTETALSPQELRALVLEASDFIPRQHQTMLLNLFDLEHISVEDIMKPRGEIEAIDIAAPLEKIREQLGTSFHRRLPVYEGDPSNVVGILLQRRLLASALAEDLTMESLREQLAEPYFIPAATPIYAQLQFFKENRQRFGLVVDEYGEIEGLVTLEDIIEEIIGKFTTSMPSASAELAWAEADHEKSVLVDGGRSLRELNRALGLKFPLDGPKTLNGLILEHLQDIPESGLSVKIGGVTMEIVQTQDRRIRMVRIFQPAGHAGLAGPECG